LIVFLPKSYIYKVANFLIHNFDPRSSEFNWPPQNVSFRTAWPPRPRKTWKRSEGPKAKIFFFLKINEWFFGQINGVFFYRKCNFLLPFRRKYSQNLRFYSSFATWHLEPILRSRVTTPAL
jgi:hypothetical protein